MAWREEIRTKGTEMGIEQRDDGLMSERISRRASGLVGGMGCRAWLREGDWVLEFITGGWSIIHGTMFRSDGFSSVILYLLSLYILFGEDSSTETKHRIMGLFRMDRVPLMISSTQRASLGNAWSPLVHTRVRGWDGMG